MLRGATPPQQDSGPRPGIARKDLRMRESDRASRWPAAVRMRKGDMLEVVAGRGEHWPGVGPGSLPAAARCGSEPERERVVAGVSVQYCELQR